MKKEENKLTFTEEQVQQILETLAKEQDGYNKVLKCAIEALMQAERKLYNEKNKDVSNGYRFRKSLGKGKLLELRVPRSRYNNFYPLILALLKDEEEEAKKLAFSLYGKGLTTKEVGEIFGELYGKHYSTSQISRLFEDARELVKEWLERQLEDYYPIIFIDACYINTRREDKVSKEAYYTILGVKTDGTREVLHIVNFPTESATGWSSIFEELKGRGVKEIGLIVSDGLSSIEDAFAKHFSGTPHQFCTNHLKKNVLKNARNKDKQEIASELKDIFRTNDSSDTPEKGWQRWIKFIDKYGKKYPKLMKMKDTRYRHYFTYLRYDYRIRNMIYTTNWIERLHKDYKRTIKMRNSLPNPESAILLLGYVAMNKKAYNKKISILKCDKSFNWDD